MGVSSRRLLMVMEQMPAIIMAGTAVLNFIASGPQISVLHLFFSAVMPIIKVLMICAVGLVFALPHVDVLNAVARKSLNNLVFSIFLPAIIFVELGAAINFHNLLKWWFIPVNVILASSIGVLVGQLVAWVCNTQPKYSRISHVLVGIGNMGNLPLVLLSAVCSDPNNPFGPSCKSDGVAYIGLGMWIAAIVMWTAVYNYIAHPQYWIPDYVPTDEEYDRLMQKKARMAIPLYDQTNSAEIARSMSQIQEAAGMDESRMNRLHRTVSIKVAGGLSEFSEFLGMLQYVAKALHFYDILRPPVLAACLAMAIGLVPALHHVVFDKDGSLRFVSDVLTILGGAMIPGILLVLGGNLASGPGSSELNTATTIGIVVTRLFVMPAIGLCIVLTADSLGWLPPDDKMFRFICMLQHTMPSSIQIGTACSSHEFGEKEVSAVLFYEHLTAVFTMTAYMIIFIFILFD